MRDLVLVALGGAIGASARYLAARGVAAVLPTTFPWGTFLINVTGCLAMGLVAGLASGDSLTPSARLFLATGILGGYTTFSAFGLEAHGLLAEGRAAAALGYALGQVVLGVVSVTVGFALARRLA